MSESEADLLEEMLGMLDDNGTFKLGMLMGVMVKGNHEQIRRLEDELGDMQVDRNQWRAAYHKLKRELITKEQREQDSQS